MTNFRGGPVKRTKEPLRWEDAAEKRTVEGWACRLCGRFYGDSETSARICCYDDAPCDECGTARRGRYESRCASCAQKFEHDRYAKMEQAEWDGKSPLSNGDDYFFDEDAVIEHAINVECKPSELCLTHCVEHNPYFDFAAIVEDCIPEDHDVPCTRDEIEAVEKAVNDLLRKYDPWCWYPNSKSRPTDSDLASLDARFNEERTTA